MFTKGHKIWLGKKHTEETKKKMSELNKGKRHSGETKKKISESKKGHIPWNKGKPCTEETKEKIRKANIGHKPSEEVKKKLSKFRMGNKYALGNVFSIEDREKMSKERTGTKNHFYGKRHSEETKKKLSETKKGKHYSPETEFKKGMIPWDKGIKREDFRGETHPSWKGGITSLSLLIRHNFKYRQWVSDVFTRDDFTCQWCRSVGHKLNAHHIKSFSSILEYYEVTTVEQALECDELWNINNGVTLCEECHGLTNNFRNKGDKK